jgi:hypothetical protein
VGGPGHWRGRRAERMRHLMELSVMDVFHENGAGKAATSMVRSMAVERRAQTRARGRSGAGREGWRWQRESPSPICALRRFERSLVVGGGEGVGEEAGAWFLGAGWSRASTS